MPLLLLRRHACRVRPVVVLMLSWAFTAAGCADEELPQSRDSRTPVPTSLVGLTVVVTVLESDAPGLVRPGHEVHYAFVSPTQVFGEGERYALPTEGWQWTKQSDTGGAMELDYGSNGREQYTLEFLSPEHGDCTFRYDIVYQSGGGQIVTGDCYFVLEGADVDNPAPATEARPAYPYEVVCHEGTPLEHRTEVEIPAGTAQCQAVYERYAEVAICNVVELLEQAQRDYDACMGR